MRRIATVIVTAIISWGITHDVDRPDRLEPSRQERGEIDKNFDAADKNHDGKLTREEAKSGSTPLIANHFDAMDDGHKGYVTKADVHASFDAI